MKKILTVFVLACMMVASAFAQDAKEPQKKGGYNHGERMAAERVAFLTNSMQLTAEEAQAFWPVYNKIEEEQKALVTDEREAFKALSLAIKEQRDEKEVSALLDKYVAAQQANVNLHSKHLKDYKKILSVEKVAKFYRANESFRRQQISRLQGRGPQGPNGPKDGRHDAPKPQEAR